jgi:nucleotide-binding universal stress UspA family protein
MDPAVTVGEVPMILLNTVLVASDFGDASDAALTYGCNLARAFGAKVQVLHVVDNLTATGVAEFYPAGLEELQTDVEESARKRLEGLIAGSGAARLNATPVVRTSAAVAHAVVDYAKEANVDMIVVGTHGRGPVAHLFVGSVAERVVRTAGCPVLVVRPSAHELVVPEPVRIAAQI